uniref:Acetyl-CoA carboxylase central domain-containing protein n=1 Tax=Branchiostoma floridae TaxID=7739 RepID=C3ZQ85_BRAFL|eukprot:XP_002589453.1 hypothetical protein BRAFLDRAFT_80152 [Branchiostoma floridae]
MTKVGRGLCGKLECSRLLTVTVHEITLTEYVGLVSNLIQQSQTNSAINTCYKVQYIEAQGFEVSEQEVNYKYSLLGRRKNSLPAKLIMSETSIFDVLPSFFYHTNRVVRMAALEVYVRRAYIAYEVMSLQHHQLSDETCAVEFQFMLPASHPNRAPRKAVDDGSLPRVVSLGENMNDLDLPPCQRMGAMVAFDSFSAFTRVFPEFLDLAAPPQADSPLFQEVMSMFRDSPPPSPSFTDRNQGFMEKGTSGMYGSSDSLSSLNEQVCYMEKGTSGMYGSSDSLSSLNEQVCYMEKGMSGMYGSSDSLSSLNEQTAGTDEPIHIVNVAIRLAQHMDSNDLSDMFKDFAQSNRLVLFDRGIRRVTFVVLQERDFPKFFTFRARDLVAEGQAVTDFRFFIRAIIRHSDLVTKEASYEYLQNEGERLLLEAMDELEVAFQQHVDKRTDCNHIFLNFVPTVIMDPTKVG